MLATENEKNSNLSDSETDLEMKNVEYKYDEDKSPVIKKRRLVRLSKKISDCDNDCNVGKGIMNLDGDIEQCTVINETKNKTMDIDDDVVVGMAHNTTSSVDDVSEVKKERETVNIDFSDDDDPVTKDKVAITEGVEENQDVLKSDGIHKSAVIRRDRESDTTSGTAKLTKEDEPATFTQAKKKKEDKNPFTFAAGTAKQKSKTKSMSTITDFFARKPTACSAEETTKKDVNIAKLEAKLNKMQEEKSTKSKLIDSTKDVGRGSKQENKETPYDDEKDILSPQMVSMSDRNTHAVLDEVSTTSVAIPSNVKVEEANPVSSSEYNPMDAQFHPIKSACWRKGYPVPYKAMCVVFEGIENDSGRLMKQNILCNLFRSIIVLSPAMLSDAVHLAMNRLGPSYEGLELGIGEGVLYKVISSTTGISASNIKKLNIEHGDLGTVAELKRSAQGVLFKPKSLTVSSVYESLVSLAKISGSKSQTQKIDRIKGMIVACESTEAKYVIRAMQGKLRIGLAEKIVLGALAQAYTMTPPSGILGETILNRKNTMIEDKYKEEEAHNFLLIRTAHCEMPNLKKIVHCLLNHGVEALPEKCHITPGVPVEPMLAHPTKGISEILTRFENMEFSCEYKYDGERAQVHLLADGSMMIYSRNLEDNTSKYPDVMQKVKKCYGSKVESFIIDCEAVAYDIENKRILPFQVLTTRKRKNVEDHDEIKVQVQLFAFDLLYLNGTSYVKENFHTRRSTLHENFVAKEGSLVFATAMDANSVENIQGFLDKSIADSCEGLMIKTLYQDASYEIANRSKKWLKLKKDYIEDGGLGDSLDLVVIGAWFGQGKRTGWYAAYLLACYNVDEDEYQAICKVGTGMTNDFLKESNEFFKEHISQSGKKGYYRCTDTSKPDVWFEPVQVWEIKAADLSISPAYLAGVGEVHPTKGISLRFPRVIRIRDDKKPEDATTSTQVAEMYNAQPLVQQNGNGGNLR
eukprot:CFRG4545T1